MKNYAMFYSYKGIGDVLIIIFDNTKAATHSENKNRVTVVYNNDEIIGYNIFDIKDVIKIKNEGMIYYPSSALVSIVNSILKNQKLPLIDVKEQSGYVIMEVKECVSIGPNKTLVTVTDGNSLLKGIIKDATLNVNDKVVVALEGTFLSTGEMVKTSYIDDLQINVHICTGTDLGIKEIKDLLVLDNDAKTGEDFFLVEER